MGGIRDTLQANAKGVAAQRCDRQFWACHHAEERSSVLPRRTFFRVVTRPKLAITPLSGDSFRIRLESVPNATHRLEWTDTIPTANWQFLTSLTTDATGVASYVDIPADKECPRFYRVLCP